MLNRPSVAESSRRRPAPLRLPITVLFTLAAFSAVAPAQNGALSPGDGPIGGPVSGQAHQILRPGFGSIELGMTVDTVKDRLVSDTYFRYRGDPDVSMLRVPADTLIETEGYTFVERGIFQFRNGRLYTITILVNQDRMDHFTLYRAFVEKYGEPLSLSPDEVVWESPAVRLSLERPLTVKYIDSVVFSELLSESRRAESLQQLSRDRFLEQF